MSLTFSQEFTIGQEAPEFNLLDVTTNKYYSYNDLGAGLITVVMFICNHCPYVKYIQKQLVKISDEFISEGVSFIAISSNDAETFPEDSPERMKEVALEFGYPFPYLYDETQEVAKSYRAACTPDFYIFNEKGVCIYHGCFDKSNHKNGIEPTGKNLANALNLALKDETLPKADQLPSSGCNIKWKSGVSPF